MTVIHVTWKDQVWLIDWNHYCIFIEVPRSSALRGDYFVNIKLYAPLFNRMLEPPYPLQKSYFDEFLFSKILF